MNLRTILGLVAALGTSPAITSCATVPDKPASPPAPAQRSFLEEILTAPQTEKKITVFYEFVDDETVDKELFIAALPYVRAFYKNNGVEITFKQSSQLEQEGLDRQSTFGLRYAGYSRLVAEMLSSVEPMSEEDTNDFLHIFEEDKQSGVSFRQKGYAVVTTLPENREYWSRVADKWGWLKRVIESDNRFVGEIPPDGEARLFAQVIAHELGHLFGLAHPPCDYPSETFNLMFPEGEPELRAGEIKSPFTKEQPFGATIDARQRALVHDYLGGATAYHAAQREENYEAWLTKHGIPACEEE